MICVRCFRPAEYNIPKSLCGECWARWVAFMDEDTPMTPQEKQQLYIEALAVVRTRRREE